MSEAEPGPGAKETLKLRSMIKFDMDYTVLAGQGRIFKGGGGGGVYFEYPPGKSANNTVDKY